MQPEQQPSHCSEVCSDTTLGLAAVETWRMQTGICRDKTVSSSPKCVQPPRPAAGLKVMRCRLEECIWSSLGELRREQRRQKSKNLAGVKATNSGASRLLMPATRSKPIGDDLCNTIVHKAYMNPLNSPSWTDHDERRNLVNSSRARVNSDGTVN